MENLQTSPDKFSGQRVQFNGPEGQGFRTKVTKVNDLNKHNTTPMASASLTNNGRAHATSVELKVIPALVRNAPAMAHLHHQTFRLRPLFGTLNNCQTFSQNMSCFVSGRVGWWNAVTLDKKTIESKKLKIQWMPNFKLSTIVWRLMGGEGEGGRGRMRQPMLLSHLSKATSQTTKYQ